MKRRLRTKREHTQASGQAMIEYLIIALAIIFALLIPIPSIVPGKLPDQASVLTQLSVALRGAYADYSWATSQPVTN
ncbi:hypothetical protein [Acidithiobacillus sp. AMEEHan]|uniref:hypothetical protein n=1 Tax=Acidithiobacillus sp. AMEEHan TaxID=2994951 RepID=UPI0027E52ECA|nr:hypothetical protein [Acidithiobacillus sp. AMEEHan]